MARLKATATRGNVPLTAAEEAARDAEEAHDATVVRPMRNWDKQMHRADQVMAKSRAVEDIFDALDATAQGRVSQQTKDAIAAKKVLRGQRP